MINTRTIAVVAALVSATGFCLAANPHIGTWKLNESKSKLVSGNKNDTVVYTETKGGMINLTVDGVDKDGKARHWRWEGKFDGQQYKVKGNPAVDTIAYNVVNDRTNSLTGMKNGQVVTTGTITVAKDGKSREVSTTTTDANGKKTTEKAYYDKQ